MTTTRRERAEHAKTHHSLADHPDRQEIVVFSAEDMELGMMTAHRVIERPSSVPAYLGPLTFIEDQRGSLAGRMIGLLPRKGDLHS